MISRSVSEATPSQARLPEQYVLSRGGVEVNPKQLLNAVIALGGFDAMDEPKWRQVEQRFEPPLDPLEPVCHDLKVSARGERARPREPRVASAEERRDRAR